MVEMFLTVLLAAAGQESDGSPKPPSQQPCHWSEEYLEWLSEFQPSTVERWSNPARPPAKVRDVVPEYPKDTLRRRNLGGHAVVEAVIDDEGKILDARLIERITWDPEWPEFDRAILDAVRQWKFEPSTVGDIPLWVCMTTSIGITWGSASQSKEKPENAKPRRPPNNGIEQSNGGRIR